MITAQQLSQIDPRTKTADPACVVALNDALAAWKISNKQAVAAFLGMVLGESGGLHVFAENMNYSSAERLMQVFPSVFKTRADAIPYVSNPQKLASRVYANRYGNGPEESGDGWKYRGMGAIQLTFKAGILAYFKAKGIDPKNDPASVLTKPAGALDSAAWYFVSRGCDKAAIAGGFKPVYKICQPSMIGLDQHEPFYLRALEVL